MRFLSFEAHIIDELGLRESSVVYIVFEDGDVIGGFKSFKEELGYHSLPQSLVGISRNLVLDECKVAIGINKVGIDVIALIS
jgi:hypothetical protein